MEEYHVKITVERGGESQCQCDNTTAKSAIYLSVLGFVLVGIPYVGWPYLALCFIVAIKALMRKPRGLALLALLIDSLYLFVKYIMATT